MFHIQSESQKDMLTGLSFHGDTGFKFTSTSSNNQDSTSSLGCACNHVFDEVSVSWDINDGHIVFAGSQISTGRYQWWYHTHVQLSVCPRPRHTWRSPFPSQQLPSRTFNCFLVNPTTFVDQMASHGRLPWIYMSSDNNDDVGLFLSQTAVFMTPVSWQQTCCKKVIYSL